MSHSELHDRPRGFTLVELLVVIGIIALLISILLPTLASARKAGNTIKCAANLRSITQAMQIYVNEYKGWMPGSALTSGYPAWKGTQANCRGVVHINDWQSPLGKIMRMKFNEGSTIAERTERFLYLMNRPEFACPANDLIATPLGTPTYPAVKAPSYVLAVQFQYEHNGGKWASSDVAVGEHTTYEFHDPPPGYVPKLAKVGQAAQKVFIACGAKYTDSSSPAVRAPLTLRYDWGGSYGDRGPWYKLNKAWDRISAPGNGGATAYDARMLSYRHGKLYKKGAADTFRFNLGFFDGHVETMGDLQGANPALWNPRGTKMKDVTTRMFADVAKQYFNNAPGDHILP